MKLYTWWFYLYFSNVCLAKIHSLEFLSLFKSFFFSKQLSHYFNNTIDMIPHVSLFTFYSLHQKTPPLTPLM